MIISSSYTGQMIKKYRKESGLTQRQLAEKIGKTESSIRKYEKGLVEIPTSVIEQIASTLGKDIVKFIIPEQNVRQNTSYYFEHLIRTLGFDITFDGEDDGGYIVLRTDDGEYEINTQDVDDITNNTCSFIKYKISEIKTKSRKIGK